MLRKEGVVAKGTKRLLLSLGDSVVVPSYIVQPSEFARYMTRMNCNGREGDSRCSDVAGSVLMAGHCSCDDGGLPRMGYLHFGLNMDITAAHIYVCVTSGTKIRVVAHR